MLQLCLHFLLLPLDLAYVLLNLEVSFEIQRFMRHLRRSQALLELTNLLELLLNDFCRFFFLVSNLALQV